ncbi:phosphoribosyltransferase [Campylobacter hominis]
MKFYGFDEFDKDVRKISTQIRDEFSPDAIVGIARGGLSFAHAISNALHLRTIFSINSIHYNENQKLDTIEVFNIPDLTKFRKILLVDDIVDSGESLAEIIKILKRKFPETTFKTAVIFYKSRALVKPDFKINKTDEWINFFWENYECE